VTNIQLFNKIRKMILVDLKIQEFIEGCRLVEFDEKVVNQTEAGFMTIFIHFTLHIATHQNKLSV